MLSAILLGICCLLVCCLKTQRLEGTRIYSSCSFVWVETWPVTLTEEHRLRVLENRVPRRILGLKRDGETRVRKEMRSEELRDLYSLPHIIRMIITRRRWTGLIVRVREKCVESFGRRI
jgi:hypothetical protein